MSNLLEPLYIYSLVAIAYAVNIYRKIMYGCTANGANRAGIKVPGDVAGKGAEGRKRLNESVARANSGGGS